MNKLSIALVVACTVVGTANAQGQKFQPKGLISTPRSSSHTSFLVGGSDNCSTADAISGVGTFSVSAGMGTATDSTQQSTCGFGGAHLDVWFAWTCTVTDAGTMLSLCNGATVDTVAAVWHLPSGLAGCPAAADLLSCNDDTCNYQSQVTFPATAGQIYMIQIGSYSAIEPAWNGTFVISTPPPPAANDDCSNAIAISGSGLFPFNNTMCTTGSQGQANSTCNFYSTTGITSDSWWTWTPSMTGTVTLTDCGLTIPTTTDTKVAIYLGSGCAAAATTAIACNDDEGYPGTLTCSAYAFNSTVTFNAVCGQTYTIQLGSYPNATPGSGNFSITETGTPCAPPVTAYCFGDSGGCPCFPGVPNGTTGNGCPNSLNPNGANLATSGSASIGTDTFTLLGSGMPNSFALYFEGTTQVSVMFGDGLRCAGGSVIRFGTKQNVSGASQFPAAGDFAIHLFRPDNAGDVRDYQCWYRNPAAFCTASTFNLTNGIQCTWAP